MEGKPSGAWTTCATEKNKGQEEFEDCGVECLFLMALDSLRKENNEQKPDGQIENNSGMVDLNLSISIIILKANGKNTTTKR